MSDIPTDRLTPIARRYWFVDRAALETLAAAVDPPRWEQTALPVKIFALDAFAWHQLGVLSDTGEALEVVDVSGPGALKPALVEALDQEHADYVQFALRAVEDFGPALDLTLTKLAIEKPDILISNLLKIDRYRTVLAEMGDSTVEPEALWISTILVRDWIEAIDGASLRQQIDDNFLGSLADFEVVRHQLVAGGIYIGALSQGDDGESSEQAEYWRARAAAIWSEAEELRSEKRIRQGREAALTARHHRDLARQAANQRAHFETYYRAGGIVRRLRARLRRVFGKIWKR